MIPDIQQVSSLKANMPRVLKRMQESHRPVAIVSNGKLQGIIQDPQSYQRNQDAITILKMMLMAERSAAEHGVSSSATVVARIRRQLKVTGGKRSA